MGEPPQDGPRGRIWLFDLREYWRQWGSRALSQAGFAVCSWGRYSWPPDAGAVGGSPDLILLACSVAREEELALVKKVAASRSRILVLALLSSAEAMRTLFLAGAYDVTDPPATADDLVALVKQALTDISGSSPYRPLLRRARR